MKSFSNTLYSDFIRRRSSPIKMKLIFLAVLLLSLGYLGSSRHIHPHTIDRVDLSDLDYEEDNVEGPSEADIAAIKAISNIKPTRFVPINNVLFFKKYEPCDVGYVRDVVGICREVWD